MDTIFVENSKRISTKLFGNLDSSDHDKWEGDFKWPLRFCLSSLTMNSMNNFSWSYSDDVREEVKAIQMKENINPRGNLQRPKLGLTYFMWWTYGCYRNVEPLNSGHLPSKIYWRIYSSRDTSVYRYRYRERYETLSFHKVLLICDPPYLPKSSHLLWWRNWGGYFHTLVHRI